MMINNSHWNLRSIAQSYWWIFGMWRWCHKRSYQCVVKKTPKASSLSIIELLMKILAFFIIWLLFIVIWKIVAIFAKTQLARPGVRKHRAWLSFYTLCCINFRLLEFVLCLLFLISTRQTNLSSLRLYLVMKCLYVINGVIFVCKLP